MIEPKFNVFFHDLETDLNYNGLSRGAGILLKPISILSVFECLGFLNEGIDFGLEPVFSSFIRNHRNISRNIFKSEKTYVPKTPT